MSKRSRFKTPFHGQSAFEFQTLLKSNWEHFSSIVYSSLDSLSWKTSLLVRSEVLGLFVKLLPADDKYCRYNRENVPQPIKMN